MKTEKKNYGEKKAMISEDKLDTALLDLIDLFSRVACKFYLIGDTAQQARDGQVKGDKLEIAVRFSELTREVLSALSSYGKLSLKLDSEWEEQPKNTGATKLDEIRKDIKALRLSIEEVPIEVRVIKRHDELFKMAESKPYKYDWYLFPNPWEKYWKIRGLIR